jgi:hypothetical protein
VHFNALAISSFRFPSAAAKTIFARSTTRVGVLRPRDHFVSIVRSSSVKTIGLATRMASSSLFRR